MVAARCSGAVVQRDGEGKREKGDREAKREGAMEATKERQQSVSLRVASSDPGSFIVVCWYCRYCFNNVP